MFYYLKYRSLKTISIITCYIFITNFEESRSDDGSSLELLSIQPTKTYYNQPTNITLLLRIKQVTSSTTRTIINDDDDDDDDGGDDDDDGDDDNDDCDVSLGLSTNNNLTSPEIEIFIKTSYKKMGHRCELTFQVFKQDHSHHQQQTKLNIFLKVRKQMIETNLTFVFKPESSFESSMNPAVTIISGGLRVLINGENLEADEEIKLVGCCVEDEDGLEWCSEENCKVVSSRAVQCKTPKLLFSERLMHEWDRETDKNISIPLNLTHRSQMTFYVKSHDTMFQLDTPLIYHDPIVKTFDPYTQIFNVDKDRRVYIKGRWPKIKWSLNQDVLIMIGDERCEDVRKEGRWEISCVPSNLHDSQQQPRFFEQQHDLSVLVKVGHASYDVGHLRYTSNKVIFNVVIITMVTILSLVVLVSVISSIIACVSSSSSSKSAGTGGGGVVMVQSKPHQIRNTDKSEEFEIKPLLLKDNIEKTTI